MNLFHLIPRAFNSEVARASIEHTPHTQQSTSPTLSALRDPLPIIIDLDPLVLFLPGLEGGLQRVLETALSKVLGNRGPKTAGGEKGDAEMEIDPDL